MTIDLQKHFGPYFTLLCAVLIMVANTYVAPVPGYMPIMLILIILACVFVVAMFVPGLREPINISLLASSTESLHSALDFTADGIAILDSKMRIVYANRQFRKLSRLTDAMANSNLSFADVMSHGCKAGIFNVPEDRHAAYCAERQAFVKLGNSEPASFMLQDGATIRIVCSTLPEGGRMLTYSDISDLAHDAERLEELAHIDGMTGLFNRRRFLELAESEWNVATRYARDLSILMIDIDHFKVINDNHGHDVGDQAIRLIASICNESKRASDIVARVGGEEFALLLPETDAAGAVVLAERIRMRAAANPIASESGPFYMTISIGVAQRTADTAIFPEMMKHSDRMLYIAKRGGRNQVVDHDAPAIALPGAAAA